MIDFEDYSAAEIIFQCMTIVFAFFLHYNEFNFGPTTDFGKPGMSHVAERCVKFGVQDASKGYYKQTKESEVVDLQPVLFVIFLIHLIDLGSHIIWKDADFYKITDPSAWRKMKAEDYAPAVKTYIWI